MITILYYNPNIQPEEEYNKRLGEIHKLLSLAEYPNSVDMLETSYDSGSFEMAAKPFLDEPEGGKRCGACIQLRLRETAERAAAEGFDCFATTLTVSPHKNATMINEIGSRLGEDFGVMYLRSDFKKRDGYKRSVELSKKYNLYRQLYCGCAGRDTL